MWRSCKTLTLDFNMTWFGILWFYILLPSLLCENLLCYFKPIHIIAKENPPESIVTECLPNERCCQAEGFYGKHRALSKRGCMAEDDRNHTIYFRGVSYAMNYSCCDWAYCNSCSGITGNLHIIAALVVVAVMVGSL